MAAPMPPVVVLIVCKTLVAGLGNPDTGWEDRVWAIEDGKMQCRRIEQEMTPGPLESSPEFTPMQCQRDGIMAMAEWDAHNRGSAYRAWRVACPTPVKNTGPDGIKGTADDQIIDWTLPDCGHPDTVYCEQDIAI